MASPAEDDQNHPECIDRAQAREALYGLLRRSQAPRGSGHRVEWWSRQHQEAFQLAIDTLDALPTPTEGHPGT